MKLKNFLYAIFTVLFFLVLYRPVDVKAACVCDTNAGDEEARETRTCFDYGTQVTITRNAGLSEDGVTIRFENDIIAVVDEETCNRLMENVTPNSSGGERVYTSCVDLREYANCDYYEKGEKIEQRDCKCKRKSPKGSEKDMVCLKVYIPNCVDYPSQLEGVDYVSCEDVTGFYDRNCLETSTTSDSGTGMVLPTGVRDLNQFGTKELTKLIGEGIKVVMGILGSVALMMFVYAGVLWMTASGNAEREKKAMQILVWSSLGVIVILSSYAIVDFVFEAFR